MAKYIKMLCNVHCFRPILEYEVTLEWSVYFMLETKIHYNVDKLEITYDYSELDLDVLKQCQVGDSVDIETVQLLRLQPTGYEFNYEVIMDRKRLGTFFFGTKNPNRPYYYLMVENRVLYGQLELLSKFEEEMGLHFRQISKLDICLDTNRNIIRRFYLLLKDRGQKLVIKNKIIKDRTAIIDSILHMSSGSLDNISKERSFLIKLEEGLELKGYDKGSEINHSNKQYIRKHLDYNERIYRMEVSFSNHRQLRDQLKMCDRRITELMLYENLVDEKILAIIFYCALQRLIRIKDGDILAYLLSPTPRKKRKSFRPNNN